MKLHSLVFSIAAATASVGAHAAGAFSLGNYSVSGIYALESLGGTSAGISGLEGSAITYARDRGTLFFVGDEGTGVVEISRTGQTLGSMAFDWSGTGSTKHDTEGLAYLGNGVLVVTEERLFDAYRFSYSAGGTATLGSNFVSISNAMVGNNGLEGISYDPRGAGSYVVIKQQTPQDIRGGSLTFATAAGAAPSTSGDGASPPGGGTAAMNQLFNPALMGLTTLSDVQTLAPIDALAGTPAADHLLVLSLGSRKLIEVDRQGNVKSTFDLSSVLPHNAIEGVTVDERGNIYLVAEQIQDGSNLPSDPNPRSQLIVLTAPVPEPETYAMLLAGLGLLLGISRRRSSSI